MGHMLRQLKCNKGHALSLISYDRNECGCHHEGKPCLVLSCKKCFEESLKTNETYTYTTYIPLDEDRVEVVEEDFFAVHATDDGGSK